MLYYSFCCCFFVSSFEGHAPSSTALAKKQARRHSHALTSTSSGGGDLAADGQTLTRLLQGHSTLTRALSLPAAPPAIGQTPDYVTALSGCRGGGGGGGGRPVSPFIVPCHTRVRPLSEEFTVPQGSALGSTSFHFQRVTCKIK